MSPGRLLIGSSERKLQQKVDLPEHSEKKLPANSTVVCVQGGGGALMGSCKGLYGLVQSLLPLMHAR